MIAETPIHADDCRALWLAILNQEIETALGRPLPHISGTAAQANARDEARRWVGGKDFHEICYLVGIEPEAVLRVYRARLADCDHEPRRRSRHPGRNRRQDRIAA